jgi:hypothetical protein
MYDMKNGNKLSLLLPAPETKDAFDPDNIPF